MDRVPSHPYGWWCQLGVLLFFILILFNYLQKQIWISLIVRLFKMGRCSFHRIFLSESNMTIWPTMHNPRTWCLVPWKIVIIFHCTKNRCWVCGVVTIFIFGTFKNCRDSQKIVLALIAEDLINCYVTVLNPLKCWVFCVSAYIFSYIFYGAHIFVCLHVY